MSMYFSEKSHLKNQKQSHESGMAVKELIRLIAVWVVIGLIGWWSYSFLMVYRHCDNVIDELKFLSNDYSIRIQQAALIPEEGVVLEKGAALKNGYYYTATGYEDHFVIEIKGLTAAECRKLAGWGWSLPYEIVPNISNGNCESISFSFKNNLSVHADSDVQGCTVFGSWNGEKCVCQTGYTGSRCQKCDVAAGFDSQDMNGKCYISAKREFCTVDVFCNGHASAVEFNPTCSCQKCDVGYFGEHCEQFEPTGDVCNGHGKDFYWYNASVQSKKGGGCDCRDGFYGRRCELTDKNQECNGHGELYGYGFCECQEGFSGKDCEQALSLPPCGTSQYAPQGQRVYLNGQSFCQCNSGYYGENCSQQCLNICKSGYRIYKGNVCGCECYNGYFGDDCSQKCTNTCKYGFAVYKDGACRCDCYGGYYGETCDMNCANQINCINGGKAVYKDGACVCECPENVFEKMCEHRCVDEITCPSGSVAFYGNGQCLCSDILK